MAQIELVQDNLNTHTYGSFYEHLPAVQARVLAQKLNFHFTPKHGSWLNMAEIEFSVLARECLNRRIDSMEKLEQQTLGFSFAYSNAEKISVSGEFNYINNDFTNK